MKIFDPEILVALSPLITKAMTQQAGSMLNDGDRQAALANLLLEARQPIRDLIGVYAEIHKEEKHGKLQNEL